MFFKNGLSLFAQKFRKNAGELAAPLGRAKNRRKYSAVAPLCKTITIEIDQIAGWYGGNRYDRITYPGQIIGGDWSGRITKKDTRLENSLKFKAIRERYENGKKWKHTDLFQQRYKKQLKNGLRLRGVDNLDDLDKIYCKYFDKLFINLEKEGVVPPSEERPDIKPIYIHINKNGELLYTVDGNHRLAMCMVLGIKTMPVRVWLRHEEWQQKRELLLGESFNEVLSPELRSYISHPDISSEYVTDNQADKNYATLAGVSVG